MLCEWCEYGCVALLSVYFNARLRLNIATTPSRSKVTPSSGFAGRYDTLQPAAMGESSSALISLPDMCSSSDHTLLYKAVTSALEDPQVSSAGTYGLYATISTPLETRRSCGIAAHSVERVFRSQQGQWTRQGIHRQRSCPNTLNLPTITK